MGAGVLETREPKSVTVGIQWRGQWDIIGDRGDEQELEVQVVEDAVVYGSEVLEYKLGIPCSKPFEEHDFVIVEERSLEDVSDPLTLLCMHQWVVDVARNDGLP